MFATVATAVDGNPLHAVLNELLSEVPDRPVKPNITTIATGNWRTRQVIRELKGLRSLSDLISTEEQIRGVVASQESRSRVKLLKAFLSGLYLVEERMMLSEEEMRCRNSLISMAESLLNNERVWFGIVWNEMYHRHCIKNEWITGVAHYRRFCDIDALMAREQTHRQRLRQIERINRREYEARRFLAVSREIDMELLRQQSYQLTSWARDSSSKLILDIAELVSNEERDRRSLESLYLLKLSLIANDKENEAARLIVNSVVKASMIQRNRKETQRREEMISRFMLLPLKEADLRNIIERNEMEKRQKLRVEFFTSWRKAFKCARSPGEGAGIVERLELYERRCLFDQWRFGFNTLYERQIREKCILEKYEAEYEVFFHQVVDSLRALWKQEGEEFNQLQKMYLDFIWSNRVIESTTVLSVEEKYKRRSIMEAEVRETVKLRSWLYIQRCEESALKGATSIMIMEENDRASLMQWHQHIVKDYLCTQICREEEELRFEIESEARANWTDIVLEEGAPRDSSLAILARLENVQRNFVLEEERQRLLYCRLNKLCNKEIIDRKGILTKESVNRTSVYAGILEYVEEWNRSVIFAERQCDLIQVALSKLEHLESVERTIIEKSEQQRYHFLLHSFDYNLPQFRAFEVDEINDRLDIINEAEIEINALAYTYGIRNCVMYSTNEFELNNSALSFFTTRELIQLYVIELVQTVEPMSRREIMTREALERQLLTLNSKEFIGRLHIEKNASDAYNSMQDLFDRILSRADEWRTRGSVQEPKELSDREALIEYFRRQEASVSVKLKAQREKTREMLSSFFEEFYWGRDSIVLQEFVARDELSNSLKRPCLDVSCLQQHEPATELSVRFYSLAIVTRDVLGPLTIKVSDSLDGSGMTCELREAQSISAAGNIFHILFPVSLLEWVKPLTEESSMLYFEARSPDGSIVATASLLIRSEDIQNNVGASVISVSLDDLRGKVNLILHVR
ncbi:uncharacterized protein TM35_000025360 [Trypanosoma theileri]|uniref:Uncharacterized protein n=1 Tax=Trypanosoma theileri TaxID=67003 RepID=A0A1X0P9S8_9TRYP|nr:uncharacterized protein TM35_000025360 [Trypanosoma theileri]ORC93210.1 hypothetical protein TM35_000025360 [Trypanosoma theileri]